MQNQSDNRIQIISIFFCLFFLNVQMAAAAEYPVLGKVVRFDKQLDNLIPADAEIEVIASGFDWTEGPLWLPDEKNGFLIFSDIPRNSIMKWREGEGISLFMKPSGYTGMTDYGRESGCNGIGLDPGGNLIFCEHGDRRLSRLTPNGGKITLADRYDGKRFNSPNALAIKSNGDIYFTPPPYRLPKGANDPMREMDFCGVYRWSASEGITLLTKELIRPNGIAFSPDEAALYVAQSDGKAPIIMAYPVNAAGTLDKGRIFYDFKKERKQFRYGSPDGMEVDGRGNLFASGPGGIYIITPEAKILGRIDTGQSTANCVWGDDGSVLYMTADQYICRIRTKTMGAGWSK